MNLRIRGEDTLCVYSNTTTPGKRTENDEHVTGSRIGLAIPGKEVNRRSAHTAPYRRTEPEAAACVTVWKHTKSLKWGFKKNSKHSGEPSGLRRQHSPETPRYPGRRTRGTENARTPRGANGAERPPTCGTSCLAQREGPRCKGRRPRRCREHMAGNTRIAPPAWVLHRAGLCPVRRVQKAPRRGDVQAAR